MNECREDFFRRRIGTLSDTRNLEAESVRNRTESMGAFVKLKTVTEIGR